MSAPMSLFAGLAKDTTLGELLAFFSAVSPATPLSIADATGPLVGFDKGGTDVAAGATTLVAPPVAGRTKVTVFHAGTAGRIWLGFDGDTPLAGQGIYLDPGGYWEEFSAGQVTALNTGTAPNRVSYQGWVS